MPPLRAAVAGAVVNKKKYYIVFESNINVTKP